MRRMFPVRVAVLIIGLVVLVMGVTMLVSWGMSGPLVIDEVEQSFSMQPGEHLMVRNTNGPITYDQWDGDEVKIQATNKVRTIVPFIAQWAESRVTVDLSRDTNGVQAVSRKKGIFPFLGGVTVHFRVSVPVEWTGDINLVTSNGTITATEINGDAKLRTSNGAISVTGQKGTLDAHTSNGRIELAEVNGAISADTSNGLIRLRSGTLTGTGRLSTTNGAINARATLAENASYEVTTANGSVTVVLVEPDVSLDISTGNGSINLRTEIIASRVERRRLIGRIGDGAAHLNIRTANGSIVFSVDES